MFFSRPEVFDVVTGPAPRLFTVSVDELAAWLGVPASWLLEEAQAGRIPSLDAGGRVLFDRYAVECALAARASELTLPVVY